MEWIKEALRMTYKHGCSQREVARTCGVSQGTVSKLLRRVREAGLGWPLPEGMGEAELEERLYGERRRGRRELQEPDWKQLQAELRSHRNLTLRVAWEEYRELEPLGYSYSRYCALYRAWRREGDVTMRQEHRPGEKLYVDYAGETVTVVEGGEAREAQIFVAAMGLSSYTYVEASWGQGLSEWIGSHVRTFEYLQGVPHRLTPDN